MEIENYLEGLSDTADETLVKNYLEHVRLQWGLSSLNEVVHNIVMSHLHRSNIFRRGFYSEDLPRGRPTEDQVKLSQSLLLSLLPSTSMDAWRKTAYNNLRMSADTFRKRVVECAGNFEVRENGVVEIKLKNG